LNNGKSDAAINSFAPKSPSAHVTQGKSVYIKAIVKKSAVSIADPIIEEASGAFHQRIHLGVVQLKKRSLKQLLFAHLLAMTTQLL
jgi:hypothetical protein